MKGFNRSLAIIIGINDYQRGIPPLTTAASDATRLAEILESEHEYEVRLLTGEVTGERLKKLLEELPLEMECGDRLLFYFAGHGIAMNGEDGPAGYLMPQDASSDDSNTFLPMTDVHDALVKLPCRHALIILDCCFAGAFRWSSTRNLLPIPAVIHKERYDRYIRDPAWQVITSAAYNERALDTLSGFGNRGDDREHSPFARALFSGLAGEADFIPRASNGRTSGDGVITATELYLYLREAVQPATEERGHRQTPGLWPLRRHDLGEYIFLTPRRLTLGCLTSGSLAPGREPILPPAPDLNETANPYRALAPYEEEHGPLFFGREEVIKALHRRVLGERLTIVVGASGTGKSSVVKAGLLPALRACKDEKWEIPSPLRPGKSPVEALRRWQIPGELREQILTEHSTPSETVNTPSLGERIENWRRANSDKRIVIVVDQFEELITQCTDENQRQEFIKQLEEALQDYPEYVRLVLTIRSDFEPQFSARTFAPYWMKSRLIVPPMSQDELRKAIEGPASLRVLYFKPYSLVDKLINDVLQTPGALPLLSYTLSELYRKYLERRGEDRALALEDYDDLGGVPGALRNRANEEYKYLPDESHRETMKRVMLRMLSHEGGGIARRRVPKTELQYADPKENDRVKTVLENLSKARLVIEDKEPDNTAVVEPAHDVLIRGWDKLLTWARSETDGGLSWAQRRRLTEDSENWDSAVRSSGRTSSKAAALLGHRSDYLVLATGQWQQSPFSFNAPESAFVQASAARRQVLNRRTRTAVSLTIVISIGLAVLFWLLSQSADKRARIAESQRLASQSQIESKSRLTLGNLLAIEAFRANDTIEAESSLLTALQRQPALLAQHSLHKKSVSQMAVESIVFSPDGKWVGSVGADRTLVLFDMDDKGSASVQGEARRERAGRDRPNVRSSWQIPLDLDGSAEALAFHPVDKVVVASGIGGLLVSVDLESGQHTRLSNSGLSVVEDLAFSPDGRWLAACGQESQVIIWDWKNDPSTPITFTNVEAPDHIRIYALRLAFSPDGNSLALACSDGNARLYSLEDRKQIQIFAHDPKTYPIRAIAFNGLSVLATLSSQGNLRLWDVQTGEPQKEQINRTDQEAYSLAFSRDGRLLAIGTDSPSIEIWHLYSGIKLQELTYHSKAVSGVAFDPRRDLLSSSGYDGLVAVWDVSTFQTLATPIWRDDPLIGIAQFSPDGRYLAAARSDQLLMWRNTDGRDAKESKPSIDKSKEINFRSLSFSKDSSVLAAGGEEYIFVRDFSADRAYDIDVERDRGQVVAIDFASSPRRAQVIRRSGYWQEWDLENQKLISEHRFTESDNVIFAAFRSSDGSFAWQTKSDLRVSWKKADGTFLTDQVIEQAIDVGQMEFSPNGQYLAWSRDDGTVSWMPFGDAAGSIRRVRVDGHPPVLAFNYSGSLLAVGYGVPRVVGYGSGNVTFFHTKTSQQIGLPLSNIIFSVVAPNTDDVIRSLNFAPDDKQLVSYSDRAGPVLWNVSREDWVTRSEFLADRNFDGSEWLQFFGPNTTYHKTIAGLPVGKDVPPRPPSQYPFLLPGCLLVWSILALVIPWKSPRELLKSRLLRIVVLVPMFGIILILLMAPRVAWEKEIPLWADLPLRLFVFASVSVLCVWAQKYLDLGCKQFNPIGWKQFNPKSLFRSLRGKE